MVGIEEDITPKDDNICNGIVDGDKDIVTVTCGYNDSTPPLRGRYVTIRRKDNANVQHLMNFCEVEVLSCLPGTWGYNSGSSQDCSNFCDTCGNTSETCGVSDGYCYTGCKDGFWGGLCNIQCDCTGGVFCNKTDGSCPSCESEHVNILPSTKYKMV